MSAKKETPRQKMIGMMYLVYTSMLAMNVSADLLNAFSLVDSGLSQTTRNYAGKNVQTYSRFTEAELLNPTKVGPWKAKAEQVHTKSSEIYEFIRDLKYRIVQTADGEGAAALLPDGEVNSDLLEQKSNTDIPAQLIIQEGAGVKLREMLVEYREYLLGLLDKNKDSSLVSAIEIMLSTEDPPLTKDGIQHTWESYRFEHIPLIAVLPQLTKVQVDVLNAEADVMANLLVRIDAGDFKFNKLSAVVIPSSDYVMRGSEFQAQIFLAASDTTQRPKVYIGSYDSTYSDVTHEWIYKMRPGYDTVPVASNGRGMLKRTAGSNGTVNWGGLIEFTGPEGGTISLPFKHSYTVAEPSLAVSPTKMNVLYLGLDNPIDVSVSGVASSNVAVSMTGGTIRKVGNSYVARPAGGARTCDIVVSAKENGATKRMGAKTFRVKKVPDPIPTIFGLSEDLTSLTKSQLVAAQGMEAKMKDFDFDMSFKVLGFKVGVTVGGFFTEQVSNGPQFTAEQKRLMSNLNAGQQVTITDIRAKGPDGVERVLQPKVYKIR